MERNHISDTQIPLIVDVEEAAALMKECFMNMKHACLAKPNPSWKERFNRLDRLETLILENKEAIEKAIKSDFGHRDAFLTDMVDILPTLSEIRLQKKNGEGWMKPRMVLPDAIFLPATAKIVPQPKGVVGIISPWNYPLLLSVGPVAQAFAAGNVCMVKLSESTPMFSALLEDLAAQYFLPTEFKIVNGDEEIGSRFSELPFDHLLFTGSTSVGRIVAEAAAKNLTPVTLELGGKSPAVITPDYPLEDAAEKILRGKLLNSGQTCIAPDYVLIEKRRIKSFVDICRKEARKMYPGALKDNDYTSIVSQKRFEELLNELQEASQAAKVESLFLGDQFDLKQRKLAPQLVINPPPDIDIMTKEIFGPILPVIGYSDDNIGESIEFITSRPHPLALYWFDNEGKRIKNAVENIQCGGITVNDTIWHATNHNLPFGGIGQSGQGRYNGKAGFETFSNLKSVFYQSRFSFIDSFRPPYTAKMKETISSMIEGTPLIKQLIEKVRTQDKTK